MKINNVNGFEYLSFSTNSANVVFFTAYNNRNFNMHIEEGQANLEEVRKLFELNKLGYAKQFHSDLVFEYNDEILDADGLMTNKSGVGIGVFTADCVPVLIVDDAKNAYAAIHSGWKGTLNEITKKAIDSMKKTYDCQPSNIKVFIGPHIEACCYEVGEEVIQGFEQAGYIGDKFIRNNKLNLTNCILEQCKKAEVKQENITFVDYCTKCSTQYELHSYRKNKNNGRLFSLVYFK